MRVSGLAIAMAALVLVAGCATPSQRISAQLVEYGVAEPQAVCVGDKLEQRLNISQLRRIGQITKTSRNAAGRVTIAQLAASLDQPGDEAIVAELLRAGVGCML